MDGDDQLKRVAVVVCDVGPREAGFAWFGTRILMVLVGTAIGRIADVGVVEMQPGHFFVVICRSVHVRGPGDEAERQVQGAAPQCEKPLHPTEYTRRLLAETGPPGSRPDRFESSSVWLSMDWRAPEYIFENIANFKYLGDPGCMTTKRSAETSGTTLHAALSSPMRLELVGLFGEEPGPLSISDMAERIGRPATSLYHHVRVLEDAGVLRRAGTRPKGKRFETLYEVTGTRLEVSVDPHDETTARQAGQTMSAALRMAERDFLASLDRDDVCTEGEHRNLTGMRAHMRLSPQALARLNGFLQELESRARELVVESGDPGPDDQFLSLTFLMAPLRGRRVAGDTNPTTDEGDPS